MANSGCAQTNEVKYKRPECGFSKNFAYKLLNEENIDWSNPDSNITVNITFDPILRKNVPKSLYHVAFFGEGAQFSNPQEVSF